MKSSSRNGAVVRVLALHTTEGIMRARDLRDWKSWPGSSHAANDETGVLMGPADGFVPYDRAAWTLRNGNPIPPSPVSSRTSRTAASSASSTTRSPRRSRW